MIVGIDPGISGALAFVGQPVIDDVHLELLDMPILTMPGKKVRHRVDGVQLTSLLMQRRPAFAYLENVHAMPDQGIASAFNFGRSFGVIIGVLEALQIPYQLIEPKSWKGAHGLIGSDKDAARGKAIQLYPHAGELLERKRDVGRADALLLAHYGRISRERAAA